MDQSEIAELQASQPIALNDAAASAPAPPVRPRSGLIPQSESGTCSRCGGGQASDANGEGPTAPVFVYAIGRIEARFPSLSLEKEFAQATGRADTTGLTDREAFSSVIAQRQNSYLARQLCWVLTIEGLETYILIPRASADLELLIEALRPVPSPMDLDIVIGVLGPLAPPQMCNGLTVPIVAFDQIYSFDRDALIKSIPRPGKMTEKEFEPAASELFDRIMLVTDNAGATDEQRALNYLTVRYPAIYASAAEAFGRNASLTAVEVRLSPLSSTRKIMEVIFSYTNRTTDVVEKFFVRVDVTEEFPFLVTKLSPYYESRM